MDQPTQTLTGILYTDMVIDKLGLDWQEVVDLMLDLGTAWVKEQFEAAPLYMDVALKSAQYWRWWKNEWNLRDGQLYEHTIWVQGKEMFLAYRENKHENWNEAGDPWEYYQWAHTKPSPYRLYLPEYVTMTLQRELVEKVNL